MSAFRKNLLVSSVLTCLVCAALTADAAAQASVPDLSSNGAGWIATNRDFVAVPGSPRPIADDPAHPYVQSKPTFRVADLTNPNLKPWAKEIMRRENEKVLAGGIAYTARSTCMPGGVPGFMMFVEAPVFFIQSIDNFRTPHTDQLHVTEHWKLAEGGKVLEVNIRIEDPGTFNAPWSAIQRYRRVERPWLEEVCAENNFQSGYHAPVANKSDF